MQFTLEQQAAIQTDFQNLILVAGAGSGKTRVLVERYLTMLEQHIDWKLTDLVAITFTEKAAREMRDRVRRTVQERITHAPDVETQQVWRKHESLLDSARIGTIHALCAQILRSNPAEVPVDPQFEVLDETDAFLMRKDAVEQALVKLVEGNHPASELLLAYDLRGVRSILEKFTGLDASQNLLEALADIPDEAALLAYWETLHREALDEYVHGLRNDEILVDALTWQPECSDPDDKLFINWRIIDSVLDDILTGNTEDLLAGLEALTQINRQGGKADSWGGKDEKVVASSVLKTIKDSAVDYLKNWVHPLDIWDEQAAHLLFLWRDAVAMVSAEYKKLKDDQQKLDFDDLEGLTVDLLATHPHVAARYAEGEFQHVMVDEFQDTNDNQRRIIYHLCGINSGFKPTVSSQPLASNGATNGRLFVVGDPKQSIYAFRGADVSVFNQVHQEIVAAGGKSLPLSQSFRTHQNLVDGFNDLFRRLLGEGDSSGYEVSFDQEMSAFRPSEHFHHTPIEVIRMEVKEYEGEKLNSESRRRWEAYEIAQHINALYQQQVPIFDKETNDYRPFEYGDVAVLFRTLKNAGLYEDVFKATGLPYVSIGSKGYYDRQEVWDLINLLQALHNQADNLSLAVALRSPLFGLSDDALFRLRLVRDADRKSILLWHTLMNPDIIEPLLPLMAEADQQAVMFAIEILQTLKNMAGRITVADLLQTILNLTAYDAILTALPDGDRRRGNVEKLLAKARESGRIGLGDFTAYLGDLTAADPREGEAALESENSIKIMTVHRSKGLEFPLVVLADAGWTKRNTGSDLLTFDPEVGAACVVLDEDREKQNPFAVQRSQAMRARRDAAENKRLFYVAATRAQDYLLISGMPNAGSWLDQFCEVMGIDGAGEYPYGWGSVRVTIPTVPPEEDIISPTEGGLRDLSLPNVAPMRPPLLADVPHQPFAPTRHISATQLEYLGTIPFSRPPEMGKRLFRQRVLHDSPPPIRPIIQERLERGQRRVIGQIVHRALQVDAWRKPDTQLREILNAYAWDEGVTDKDQSAMVVKRALNFLRKFKDPIPTDADLVLREIPFVYDANGRVIHGVIDVLYRVGDEWIVLDYKTVAADDPFQHSERYYYQLGAYAKAVEARTGQLPQVQLFYLRENQTGVLVPVEQGKWQAALDNLDQHIFDALE